MRCSKDDLCGGSCCSQAVAWGNVRLLFACHRIPTRTHLKSAGFCLASHADHKYRNNKTESKTAHDALLGHYCWWAASCSLPLQRLGIVWQQELCSTKCFLLFFGVDGDTAALCCAWPWVSVLYPCQLVAAQCHCLNGTACCALPCLLSTGHFCSATWPCILIRTPHPLTNCTGIISKSKLLLLTYEQFQCQIMTLLSCVYIYIYLYLNGVPLKTWPSAED